LGNNIQILQLEKVMEGNRVGVRLQRIQNDPRRLVGTISTAFLGPINWNDLATGVFGQWRFGKLVVKGECLYVRSNNYGWEQNLSMHNIFGALNFLYNW
jgi:hypothetical protein